MINLKTLGAMAALLAVTACATALPPPTATFDNIQTIRSSALPPLALGDFIRGQELPARRNQSLQIRADRLKPPSGGSFSSFLKQTFEAELAGAGKLDQNSAKVLSAELTQSNVSTAAATSRGVLGARFTLQNNGVTVFEKELRVEEEWPSAFLGYVAITDASNHYTGFYPQLVSALLQDEDFLIAVQS